VILAAATPTGARGQQTGLSPTKLFGLADEARAAGRIADAEVIYRALTKDPDIEIRSEARFRLGMMLADQKRYRDAATAFRELLDEKPGAVRVRLELARVLALMGNADAARRQLRQAQAAGLPPDVAALVDQFSAALRSSKPFGGSIELSLAPDTNINRATSAATLDTVIAPLVLDRDARTRSGLGVKIGAQAYARLAITQGMSLLGRVSGNAMLYRARQFDDVATSVALGPEILVGKRDRVRPALSYGWRYYGGRLYARTPGVVVNWLHVAGKRGQIESEISVTRAQYALNELQDGWIYAGSVAVERAFGQRSGGSLTVDLNRQSTKDPGYASTSEGATALAWRDIGWSTAYANVSYRRLRSDDRLFLFPKARSDNFFRVGAGATFRKLRFGSLAPVVRIAWERNRSTVGIYDYRRLSAEIGITRAF
jgi:hypothetical protein